MLALAEHQRSRGTVRLSVGTGGLHELYQSGCGRLRLPRGGSTEAVLVNTSGGLTGGDVMDWQLAVGPSATLTATTQACERIYRATDSEPATVATRLAVGAGGHIAWLPQETILFDDARLDRTLDVEMAEGATGLFCEALLFGRAAMGERVERIGLRDRWRIRRHGRLIHAEAFAMHDVAALAHPHGLAGHAAMATVLLIAPDAEDRLAAASDCVSQPTDALTDGHAAVSSWNGKLLVRLLAQDGYTLRARLLPLLALLGGSAVPKAWTQ
ncbi:urease accessory protein UreD [Rhizobiaceae bacterium]|nr:urease accessory protein UreD [Rhizobiaceae bacterium]